MFKKNRQTSVVFTSVFVNSNNLGRADDIGYLLCFITRLTVAMVTVFCFPEMGTTHETFGMKYIVQCVFVLKYAFMQNISQYVCVKCILKICGCYLGGWG